MAARNWKDVVLTALHREKIIGDYLKAGWQPAVELKVSFPSAAYDLNKVGLTLSPAETAQQPELSFEADADKLYTLVMVDKDAPSRENPKFGFWRHWIRVNVEGNKVADTGFEVSPYIGPGPPPKTGLHRYVFLVYQQEGGRIEHDFWGNDGMDGKCFDFQAWAEQHKLGEPLAAWYFQSQNDEQ